MKTFGMFLFVVVVFLPRPLACHPGQTHQPLPQHIKQHIWDHKDGVDEIINYILNGAGHHSTYRRLQTLTDDFGHRVVGSQVLEDSIDWVMDEMRNEGFQNVEGQEVNIPNVWLRGHEEATLLEPRNHSMHILGLYTSVATPPGGITAEVLVVESFEELQERKDEAVDKIVVYNQPWINYGLSNMYRTRGATEAGKVGAVAALVRSVTGFSVYSPHTGMQSYQTPHPRIPVACITVEDAQMLHRFQKREKTIKINLKIEPITGLLNETRNLIGELPGSEIPNEYVMFGGHIDSWDVGTGAMDDAGGCVISWEAMNIIKDLNLNPKRTIRTVMWSAEEIGIVGAPAYFEQNKHLVNYTSIIMESDSGTFLPYGIGFTGVPAARAIMQEILDMTARINTTRLGLFGGAPDTGNWLLAGVPGGNLLNYNDDYFTFHHSEGDTMTVEDPDHLDLCTALWASVAYVVADLDMMLPRDREEHEFSTDVPEPTTQGNGTGAMQYDAYFWMYIISILVTKLWT